MSDVNEFLQNGATESTIPNIPPIKGQFALFNSLKALSEEIQAIPGMTHDHDFESLADLTSDFIESSENHLIMSIKDFDSADPNNILFLTLEKAFLYSKNPPPPEAFKPFTKIYGRPYGRSTVLVFLVLNKVLDTYKKGLENLIKNMKGLEQQFESRKYRDLYFELERLNDKTEDFHDLLLRLQQRGFKQVETRYISFDYSVLIAESQSVQERCQRRLSMLRELSRDNELRVTTELNFRIERLNDVVRKLTAITVILMIPNLIASHFGMNFTYMPELALRWAYPTVIGVQVFFMVVGYILFRKIGWL